jgi:hypothetical protein
MLDAGCSILDRGNRVATLGWVGGSSIEDRVSSIWFIVVALLATASHVGGQELVPAAYTPAPYGINLVQIASMYNSGDLTFAPSIPIEDASGKITGTTLNYTRTLKVAGRSANISVIVPYVVGQLEGLYLGEPAFADRSGLADLGFRCAVNLFGAPAMSQRDFQAFRPRTLVGVSLFFSAPTGQYDPAKIINIGTNRWAFKPEIAVVRVMGQWAIDAYLGGWFYTDNTDFFNGKTRAQDPMISTQFHLRYLFRPGLWAAFDANFWRGGQSTVDGVVNDDLQNNSRVGATVAIRLGRHQSLRIAASRGAVTRIGGDFESIGVSYGYSWVNQP